MIIYENNKKDFFEDIKTNQISDKIKELLISNGIGNKSDSEINSWTNSLNQIRNLLDTDEIPNDIHIAAEYKIPANSKRIDCIITGYDNFGNKNAIVIELKQWNKVDDSGKSNLVKVPYNGIIRIMAHPSQQADEYKYLLNSYSKPVNDQLINCFSCAYLHNAEKIKNQNLLDPQKYPVINNSPIYFKDDYYSLQNKIKHLVCGGKGKEILYELDDNDNILPSKKLAKFVGETIYNDDFYKLVGSQVVVYENIVSYLDASNNVFIVNGNPGTGKSVVALKLLGKLISEKKNAIFVTPNNAFRQSLINQLKEYKKATKNKEINPKHLFTGSASFFEKPKDLFDWIIVDEAHRLKDKTANNYFGESQLKDILNCGKNVVFFVDDNQRIRKQDIGSTENIIKEAELIDKYVHFNEDFKLQTQFRCTGADGYINAVDNVLQIQDTDNYWLNDNENYEFKIVDTPFELQQLLQEKVNQGFKQCKLLSGYAWEHISKDLKDDDFLNTFDITIPEHNWKARWNKIDSSYSYVRNGFDPMEVGSVHMVQGLEFDYCGVIIANDLAINQNNELEVSLNNYYDKVGKHGYKDNKKAIDNYLKNIYKILLTRGQKGTFVFIRGKKLKEYFERFIKRNIR